jgi:hypothetical protein
MNQHRLSITRRALLALAAVSLAASPALADPPPGKGRGKNKHAEASAGSNGGSTVSVSFSVSQARGIALDVGATGYRPLPPGIRKNLARGKPLPPGIAKKYAPAPMVSRLPVYPGHEWRVVGTDLVLLAVATAIVVDVLSDVFR